MALLWTNTLFLRESQPVARWNQSTHSFFRHFHTLNPVLVWWGFVTWCGGTCHIPGYISMQECGFLIQQIWTHQQTLANKRSNHSCDQTVCNSCFPCGTLHFHSIANIGMQTSILFCGHLADGLDHMHTVFEVFSKFSKARTLPLLIKMESLKPPHSHTVKGLQREALIPNTI